jgi:hypothetical protein
VLAAIVGAAGLLPTLAAAEAGKRLLVANKEAVVCAGALLVAAIERGGGVLLPVDSEHNAIHQCLAGCAPRRARSSTPGADRVRVAPFLQRDELEDVTPGRGLRPSELGHGTQDLGRFGDSDEQGPRGDRGELAVRPAGGTHRRRSSIRRASFTRWSSSPTDR